MADSQLSSTAQGAGLVGVRTLRSTSPRIEEDDISSAEKLPLARAVNSEVTGNNFSTQSGPDPLAVSTVESWSHAELVTYVIKLGLAELVPNLKALQADGRAIPMLMGEKMMQFAVGDKVKRLSLVMAMRVAFAGCAAMALEWPVSRVRSWLIAEVGLSERAAKRASKNLVHGAFLASMPAEQLMSTFKISTVEEAETVASVIASNEGLHDLADAVGLAMEMQIKGSGFINAENSGEFGDDEGVGRPVSSTAFRGSIASQFGDESVQMPGSPTRLRKGSSPIRQAKLPSTTSSNDPYESGLTSTFLAQQANPPIAPSDKDSSESIRSITEPKFAHPDGSSMSNVSVSEATVLLPLARYQAEAEDEAEKEGMFSKIRWNRSDIIGRGAFGAVYRAFDMSSGKFIAVKELVQVDTDELKEQVQEIRLLKDLVHPNVVAYLGASMREKVNDWGATEPVLCIATELMPGGSIASIVEKYGPLEEPVVQRYTKDILAGLSYLHSQKLVHRDIKPANCLVGVDGVVKLADFGESKKLSASMTGLDENRTMKGTPYFMAPEVLLEDGHGRRADIWSVGATVIAMATGHPPWRENGYHQIVQLVLYLGRNPNAVPQVPATCSEALRKFLSLCFQRDPSKRLLAADLREHVSFGGLAQATDGVRSNESVKSGKGVAHPEGSSTIKRIISTGERMIDRQRGGNAHAGSNLDSDSGV